MRLRLAHATSRHLFVVGALAAMLGPAAGAQAPDAETRPREGPYATQAIRALVTRAVARNASRPAAYRARLEQETAVFTTRDGDRVKRSSLQQVASTLHYTAAAGAEQHVQQYRGEQYTVDATVSQALRAGWVAPLATGDRFRLRQPLPSTDDIVSRTLRRGLRLVIAEPETVAIVHPLARDRERFYRVERADTVAMQTDSATGITAIRLAVGPRRSAPVGAQLFTGDVFLEARTLEFVRMIGRVDVIVGDIARTRATLRGVTQPIAYVEIVANSSARGVRLPTYTRVDFVWRTAAVGSQRTIAHIVTTAQYDSIGSPVAATTPGTRTPSPDPPPPYHVRTDAPDDDDVPFTTWINPYGTLTGDANDARFARYFPDDMQPTGPASLRFDVRREEELYHFNRVEGLYTGLGGALFFRDAMPGAVLRANAGWAWHEKTARGAITFERPTAAITGFLRAERTLDLTNDFRSPYDSGAVFFPALLGADFYDYVDRRAGGVGGDLWLGEGNTRLRVTGDVVSDRGVATNVRHDLFGGKFLPNRGVDPGTYARVVALLEWNRDVEAEASRIPSGGLLKVETANGGLQYQRIEARLVGRLMRGRLSVVGRLYGGAVLGSPPPQQLFELGAQQNLPGYRYKEFAGDRAAVFKLTTSLPLSEASAPLGEIAGFVIPPVAPTLSLGLQAGWTGVATSAGRASLARLGPVYNELTGAVVTDPVSGLPQAVRETDGVRTTVSIGIRLFGGMLYVGAGRPLNPAPGSPSEWRGVITIGQVQ